MRLSTIAVLASALIASHTSAFAGEKCAYQSRDKWIPIEQAIEKAQAMGYDVRNVEADDGCWEVEGYDRHGAKIKLYLHPVSGDVVKHDGPAPR